MASLLLPLNCCYHVQHLRKIGWSPPQLPLQKSLSLERELGREWLQIQETVAAASGQEGMVAWQG